MNWHDAIALVVVAAAVGAAWSWRRQMILVRQRHADDLADARAHMEAELRRRAHRGAFLFEWVEDGVLVIGLDGRVRLANRPAAVIFGFGKEVIGQTVFEATQRNDVAALMEKLPLCRDIWHHEMQVDRLCEPQFIDMNAHLMTGPDGEPDGALLVFRDRTRIRHVEARRRDFAANVTREMAKPLAAIQAAAETLLNSGHDAEVSLRMLDTIDRQTTRARSVLEDLSLLGRLEAGAAKLNVTSVPLRRAVNDVLVDAASAAARREITLRNEVPSGFAIDIDADLLRRVLAGLIEQAIQHARDYGVVTVTACEHLPGRIEVGVCDDGRSLPFQPEPTVFERFYEVDVTPGNEGVGPGLGLALVKRIIEAHDGTVRMEHAWQRGTGVYFTVAGSIRAADVGAPMRAAARS